MESQRIHTPSTSLPTPPFQPLVPATKKSPLNSALIVTMEITSSSLMARLHLLLHSSWFLRDPYSMPTLRLTHSASKTSMSIPIKLHTKLGTTILFKQLTLTPQSRQYALAHKTTAVNPAVKSHLFTVKHLLRVSNGQENQPILHLFGDGNSISHLQNQPNSTFTQALSTTISAVAKRLVLPGSTLITALVNYT